MGHQVKGHFSTKHKDQRVDKDVSEKIRAMAHNDSIKCSSAHQIAKVLNLPSSEIGVQIDLLEFRITECQLGLFGYGNGEKRINPEIEISPDLDAQLKEKATNGSISCFSCWDIGGRLKMKRLDVGSACEKKNIRIKPCQLGSF